MDGKKQYTVQNIKLIYIYTKKENEPFLKRKKYIYIFFVVVGVCKVLSRSSPTGLGVPNTCRTTEEETDKLRPGVRGEWMGVEQDVGRVTVKSFTAAAVRRGAEYPALMEASSLSRAASLARGSCRGKALIQLLEGGGFPVW